MIGILLTVLVAALVYLLLAALTGSAIVAIIGAILVPRMTGPESFQGRAATSSGARLR